MEEMNRIANSGVSSRKKGTVLNELQNRLSSLSDDNIKTY
jgi:hypothetical protein